MPSASVLECGGFPPLFSEPENAPVNTPKERDVPHSDSHLFNFAF